MILHQDVNRYYNHNPEHLHFRTGAVRWLRRLNARLKCSELTWHLAVAIFDSLFSRCSVLKEQLKLVTFVSFYLAAKHNEKSS